MVRSLDNSGVFFGASSRRATLPVIHIEPAPDNNTIAAIKDAASRPAPAVTHLQPMDKPSNRRSYLSTTSNSTANSHLSSFIGWITSAPQPAAAIYRRRSAVASSFVLPEGERSQNTAFAPIEPLRQSYVDTKPACLETQHAGGSKEAKPSLSKIVFSSLLKVFSYSVGLLNRFFEPIKLAYLDSLQYLDNYCIHGTFKVKEIRSDHPVSGFDHSQSLHEKFQPKVKSVPEKQESKPANVQSSKHIAVEYKLPEFNFSRIDISVFYNESATIIVP